MLTVSWVVLREVELNHAPAERRGNGSITLLPRSGGRSTELPALHTEKTGG